MQPSALVSEDREVSRDVTNAVPSVCVSKHGSEIERSVARWQWDLWKRHRILKHFETGIADFADRQPPYTLARALSNLGPVLGGLASGGHGT